jgi:hypothetical protein
MDGFCVFGILSLFLYLLIYFLLFNNYRNWGKTNQKVHIFLCNIFSFILVNCFMRNKQQIDE